MVYAAPAALSSLLNTLSNRIILHISPVISLCRRGLLEARFYGLIDS